MMSIPEKIRSISAPLPTSTYRKQALEIINSTFQRMNADHSIASVSIAAVSGGHVGQKHNNVDEREPQSPKSEPVRVISDSDASNNITRAPFTPRKRRPVSQALKQFITDISNETAQQSPPVTPPTGCCTVCLSSDESLVYSCKEQTVNPNSTTTTTTTSSSITLPCQGALCLDCTKTLVQAAINNSLCCIPGIKCPGRCFTDIPTAVWRGLVSVSSDDRIDTIVSTENEDNMEGEDIIASGSSGDLEQLLVARYERSVSALLSIRCGSCDQTYNLTECTPCLPLEKRAYLVTEILSCSYRYGNADSNADSKTDSCQESCEKLFEQWTGFMRRCVSGNDFARCVSNYYDKYVDTGHSSTEDASLGCSDQGIWCRDKDIFVREYILPLMLDIERRAQFLLCVYRTFPKFYTLCCNYPHCFSCQLDEWHPDMSCEEQQMEELGIYAQFCPSCSVPTIRTDGCSDMLCVCGEIWKWDGDEDEHDY